MQPFKGAQSRPRILRPLGSGALAPLIPTTPISSQNKKGSQCYYAKVLWNRYMSSDKPPDVFKDIQLARDGGLGDVRAQTLLYSMQYWYAFQVVAFILMNVTYVIIGDFSCAFLDDCSSMARSFTVAMQDSCIADAFRHCNASKSVTSESASCLTRTAEACTAEAKGEEAFLLTRWILADRLPAERIITILELVYLGGLLVKAVRLGLTSYFAKSDFLRWVSVYHLFWQTLPRLSCFSLMRLLYYVTPTVIGTQAYYVFQFVMERIKKEGRCSFSALRPVIWYLVTRPICFIIGFDAFLVKLRIGSHSITTGSVEFSDIVSVIVLLFQILGVVNLNWFVRARLFIFTFGAENGNMSNAQKAQETVWNSMLAKRIYEVFPFWQFIVVMLGFDDYDFQVLVLDQVKVPFPCPSGHELRQTDTPTEGWTCDVCKKTLPVGTQLWDCRACNFDACSNCKSTKMKEDIFQFEYDGGDIYKVITAKEERERADSFEELLLKYSI